MWLLEILKLHLWLHYVSIGQNSSKMCPAAVYITDIIYSFLDDSVIEEL